MQEQDIHLTMTKMPGGWKIELDHATWGLLLEAVQQAITLEVMGGQAEQQRTHQFRALRSALEHIDKTEGFSRQPAPQGWRACCTQEATRAAATAEHPVHKHQIVSSTCAVSRTPAILLAATRPRLCQGQGPHRVPTLCYNQAL